MHNHSYTNLSQIALYELVEQIPEGKVASYGQLAAYLPQRVPALVVGRWMAVCPPHLPWWRVLGATGVLLIANRNPEYARQQAARLKAEGVPFLEPDQVDVDRCRWIPDEGCLDRLYLSGE